MRLRAIISLFTVLLTLPFSVAHADHASLARDLQSGMLKRQVLGVAGNPTLTRRAHGVDKWIYTEEAGSVGSNAVEVDFQDGRAVYVGSIIQPKISGAEQDRMNEASNLAESKRLAVDERAKDIAENTKHAQSRDQETVMSEKDADYQRIKESISGPSDSAERLKVAPHFETVQ